MTAEPPRRLGHHPPPRCVGASQHRAHVTLAERFIDGRGDRRHGGSLRPDQLGQATPLLAVGRGKQTQGPPRQIPRTMTTVGGELGRAVVE